MRDVVICKCFGKIPTVALRHSQIYLESDKHFNCCIATLSDQYGIVQTLQLLH
jgi:hypothetical protein